MTFWRRAVLSDPLVLLALCCAAHAGAMFAVTESWWAPNLTVVGLILAVVRAPGRWLACSIAAALTVMIWTVRFPAVVAGTYVATGWFVRWVATQWDVSDPLVQRVLVAAVSAVMAVSSLWLHGLWSVSLAASALAHVVLTYAAFCTVRWLLPLRAEVGG
jgi:hypothetical protein